MGVHVRARKMILIAVLIADLTAVRERFESGWVRWNVVRAVTSTASLAALVWAALRTAT